MDAQEVGQKLVKQVISVGMNGAGAFKPPEHVAAECLRTAKGDPELAIKKTIRQHVTYAATTGALTGLGGFLTLPVTIPGGLAAWRRCGWSTRASRERSRISAVMTCGVRTCRR